MCLILCTIYYYYRYTLQVLSDIARSQGLSTTDFNDDNIVHWANQRVAASGKTMTMKNFRDPSLSNSLFLLTLVHTIEPRAVDWDIALNSPQSEEDKMNNARYAISCARKFGACVFLTPEDICEVKAKMLLTFVAAIWQQDLTRGSGEAIVTASKSDMLNQISHLSDSSASDSSTPATPSTVFKVATAGKYNKDGTPNTGASPSTAPKWGTPTTNASGVNTSSKFNKDGTPNKNYIPPVPKK